MSLTASRPATPVVASVPQGAPTPPDREPNSLPAAHPFAELLRQNRGVDPAPTEPPRPAKTADAAARQAHASEAAGNEEAPPTDNASTRSDAGRARARSAASSRASTRTTGPAERPERERDGVTPREPHDDDSRTATDATAANPAGAARPEALRRDDFEPRVRAAAEAQQLGEAAGRRAGATTDPTGASESASDTGSARTQRLEGDLAGPAGAGRSLSRSRDRAETASTASFTQALAEAKAQDRPAAAAAAERPALPALASAVAPHEPLPQAAPAGESSTLTATVPAPIDSPEFASALGVQVSVFVREGVQHAELHLNPAETGPVSITITLDGTQARVEFGADLAATRQAIENGLPALASALRDAGFTLAGGGVAQHSRPGGGQGGDAPAERGDARRPQARGSDSVAAAGQRIGHRIMAGGVDVYA